MTRTSLQHVSTVLFQCEVSSMLFSHEFTYLQVYDTITERRLMKTSRGNAMPSIGLRRLGAASSFVVSGVVHEIILWCG